MKKFFCLLIACVSCLFGLTACDSHTYAEEWSWDGNYHWHEVTCEHDIEPKKEAHKFMDNVCSVCGYKKSASSSSGGGSMNFKLDDGGYTLTDSGSQTQNGNLEIPSEYGGKPVTGIGEYAISTWVKKVTVPASVTTINDKAFTVASVLESIEVSTSNKNYTSYGGILYNKAKTDIIFAPIRLQGSVSIASGVTYINVSALRGRQFSSVTLPKSVTVVCENAFADNHYLTSVDLGSGVKGIRTSAFSNCDYLVSIKMGTGIEWIMKSAFEGCYKVKDITYSGTKAQWNKITKSDGWNGFANGCTVHCSNGDIKL